MTRTGWRPDGGDSLGGESLGGAGWIVREGGGRWERRADRITVRDPTAGWSALELPAAARLDGEIAFEATVSGTATAAGLSFGPYVDFLAPLRPGSRARRLSVELHPAAGTWTFRVDGRLTTAGTPRRLPDAAPALKAFRGSDVVFADVRIRRFPARCRLSIVLTCHRFLQRLRVALAAWCRQDAPSGSIEVIVVNPASPDGTAEHLAAVAASFPQVRVRELFVDGPAHKAVLINHGVLASSGEWIWLTDADCLFPTSAASTVLREVDRATAPELLYGGRRHLRRDDTEALLAMAVDGVADFAALARRADADPPDLHPWGYTQIVPRDVLLSTPYQQDIPHFAHSDGAFVEACRRRGIPQRPVPGLHCLHLEHPFAWYGTDAFC